MSKKVLPVGLAAIALLAVVGGFKLATGTESEAQVQTTEDAFVQADVTQVAPQIGGQVSQVLVKDYQHVEQGEVIAVLDTQPWEIALKQAKATVINAYAAIGYTQAQLKAQKGVIAQAQASLKMDETQLAQAQYDLTRYQGMYKDGSGTEHQAHLAQTQVDTLQAQTQKDQAILETAKEQLWVLQARLEQANAQMETAKAQEADAQLNLSYTKVTAPISGVVTQRHVQQGNFVRVGESLLTIVPMDALYVEANFRETQIANMAEGQPVSLSVDALPGQIFAGKVVSFAPATGSSFSALAAHNATGNFTKIVQRLPVRIALQDNGAQQARLKVGMSVHVEVDTQSVVRH